MRPFTMPMFTLKPHSLTVALIGALVALGSTSSTQAQAPGADLQMLLLQMLQQRQSQIATTQGAVPSAQRPPATVMTEPQLGQQLQAWAPAKGPFEIERFRDGFSINGQRTLDPEGQITHYAVDSETGDNAYMAQVMPGQFVLKLARHQTGPAIAVAQVTRQGGTWLIETNTGVKLNGSRLILSPRGVTITRDNVFFTWTAGAGTQSFAAPDNYSLAAHQNGDVAGTGWVLLEKRTEAKAEEGGVLAGSSLGALIGSVKRIGVHLGANTSDTDYALYQLSTRKMIPLGIAMEEKQAQFMSQCHQKNKWVSMCDRMDSMESVYGQDGMPNRGHYYWRVAWYRSAQGPIALVMENGITKIDAIRLDTEQRAQVFQRSLGISDWSSNQGTDGRIRVRARLGFDTGAHDDVAALFDSQVSSKQ
jgi:hypothetical protein